jgi:serine/threonine protein kinase/Tol biopolymer transport system component
MPLTSGTRLAHYEILAPIGSGGMGDVYHGRDTKLNRDVAIKILPEAFAEDADRMVRFSREAQVLASLNHPNIAAIYGVEDRALIMEMVDGPMLSERIAEGAIPLEEATPIIGQLIDALEYAHEKCVVHRDLKPANVKITPEGRVKVLDFGLAKAFGAEVSAGDPASSPTLTMRATLAGVIMGTAGYMSPEQTRGQAVDKRADIWAFGVVVYEMLTGRRLFGGETVSDTLAAVLKEEPACSLVPEPMRRLVRTCLMKDVRQRMRDIGDARLLMNEAPAALPSPQVQAAPRRMLPWATAAGFAVISAVIAVLHFRETAPERTPIRFQIQPPENTSFEFFALSPDGRQLAFVALGQDGRTSLWYRALASVSAHEVPGTQGAIGPPFWSPDSRFIGFVVPDKLKKVYVGASVPASVQTICDVPHSVFGASWNQDGIILFGTSGVTKVFRVSQAGGTPAPLQFSGQYPWFLPDGRRFLYSAGFGSAVPSLQLATLDGKERTLLVGDQSAQYAPPVGRSEQGHLLFVRDGALVEQPIDPVRFKLAGEAVPVAEGITSARRRRAGLFSVSANGLLAYLAGTSSGSSLTWFDREGKPQPLGSAPAMYNAVTLSPDGTRAALTIGDGRQLDIWLLDVARGVPTRFTDDPSNDAYPVWSPDGKRLVFGSLRDGPGDLYQKDAGGAAREQPLLKTPLRKGAFDWSADGRFLLYSVEDPKTKLDLWVLPLDSTQKPAPFVAKPYNESQGQFYPEPAGIPRWIAFTSDETGQLEIYVESFPAHTERVRISSGGGTQPRWRRDGKELYYIASDRKLMAVEVKTAPRFKHGVPKPLFDSHVSSSGSSGQFGEMKWASAPDGKRFLCITQRKESASAPITIVTDWQASLRQ